uniref:BPTI/Kunitz inhibitor domain-containing protein n=1 Tax=Romanomermis culicivorax TaxID=13658 RepID=A0A915JM12_ROMCU
MCPVAPRVVKYDEFMQITNRGQIEDYIMYKAFVISTIAYYLLVAVQGDCSSDKDKGTETCGSTQSIRWYFNQKKFRCMAFTYLGCGGNGNNYITYDKCQTCSPADGPTCLSAAFSPPPPRPAGSGSLGPRWCKTVGCPTGYECQNGGMTSQCCNSTTENWFKEAENPKCKDGQTALQLGGHTIVADSCSDLSCPEGHYCETTNQLFAKCC